MVTKKNYAISTKGLRKSFGEVRVLEGIDLRVERGTILALLGPNGAGKTTTVRILTTLLKPDGGSAVIEGFDVQKQEDEVRSIIGLTGQYAAIDEYLTGRENLRMMGRLYHLGKQDSIRRADELLEQFDLVDAADRPAKTYSGGMRRRLDLAASLVATPSVLFLDEPTTGLDPRSRLAVWDVIDRLAQDGSTILLTTQYMEEADHLADRIAVIDGGKVIAEGTTDELKQQIGKERIAFEFATAADFDKAAKTLKDSSLQSDERERTMSIANDGGVKKLKEALEKLEKSKVSVNAVSLRKPTLDDVFLKLTGHEATKDEENGASKSKEKK